MSDEPQLLIDQIEQWLLTHMEARYLRYMRYSQGIPTHSLNERAMFIAADVMFSGDYDECTVAEVQEVIADRLVTELQEQTAAAATRARAEEAT